MSYVKPRVVAVYYGWWRLVRTGKGKYVIEERSSDAVGEDRWNRNDFQLEDGADGSSTRKEIILGLVENMAQRIARRRRSRRRKRAEKKDKPDA